MIQVVLTKIYLELQNKYTKYDSNTYQEQSINYYNEMWSTASLSSESYRY